MINNISNNIIIKAVQTGSGKSGLNSGSPAKGSFQSLQILDKLNGNYRLLINGKVFQSKLPVNVGKGELMLAKVINQQPLTLSLDNLLNGKMFDGALLSNLLNKLNIKETDLSKNLLQRLVLEKKPVIKSKYKRLLEYLDDTPNNFDDLQVGLMIEMLWQDKEPPYTEYEQMFDEIFDLSFFELSELIYKTLLSINEKYSEKIIVQEMNSGLILHLDSENEEFAKLKDKSNLFTYFLNKINSPESYVSSETDFKVISDLFLKYILQKSVYMRFGFHPEFAIISEGGKTEFIVYKTEKSAQVNSGNTLRTAYNSDLQDSDKLKINTVLVENKITGEAVVKPEKVNKLTEVFNRLNSLITKEIGIDSLIYPVSSSGRIGSKDGMMVSVNATA
jgi:hypothetical protein